MSPKVKLTVYAVLLIFCAWFGGGFYSNYSVATRIVVDAGANAPGATPDSLPNTNNAFDTNAGVVPATNAPAAQTNVHAPVRKHSREPAPERNASSARSAMVAYLAAFVLAALGLGLLIALDVTHYVGSKAVDVFFDNVGEAPHDPEYERAEEEWVNGKYLEAIQMMRDFLQKNPRQVHAAVRIAEIYEKDLKNLLAAALEYEEVLKHRLPAERWGWTAVHLCNLYSKLNQGDKALALLRRVAQEHPKTKAAKKARAHLGMAEPEPEPEESAEEANAEEDPELTQENQVIIMEEHPPELEPRDPSVTPPPEPPEPSKPSEASKKNLPPGFRPRQ